MSLLDNGFYWFICFVVPVVTLILVIGGCRAAAQADDDTERDYRELQPYDQERDA